MFSLSDSFDVLYLFEEMCFEKPSLFILAFSPLFFSFSDGLLTALLQKKNKKIKG